MLVQNRFLSQKRRFAICISLTENKYDVRIITRKHGLQRQLLLSEEILPHPRVPVFGWVFYLRLYLESRKANSLRNSAIMLTTKPIVVTTMDKISYAVTLTALLS